MEKDGFHPHTETKGVRKSRDQTAKKEGVKIRKQRLVPLGFAKRQRVEKKLKDVFGDSVEFHDRSHQTGNYIFFANVKAITPEIQSKWARNFPNRSYYSLPKQSNAKRVSVTIDVSPEDFEEITKDMVAQVRKSRSAKVSTSLGSILSPPKKEPKALIASMKQDLDFRDKLLEENQRLKEEIKSDPQSEFAPSARAEFNENAKEIRELGKDAKRAFNDLPKESKETLDRDLINRLRVVR